MAKHSFQTEVNQILHLVIHSLYSNKEIFLRELISNSSDALDKLKFLTLTDEKYKNLKFDPKIEIFIDKDKKILTIKDNGIGMDEEDLKSHLGTVAKSGTKSFIEQLTGDNKKDSNLIGQFGVGFYSSFMVANKVEVKSKKAGTNKAYIWLSEGTGEYEINECQKEDFGTSISIFLKDDAKEYLETHRIENIIEKYSNHIPFPIFLEKEVTIPKKDAKEGDEKKEETTLKLEQVNKASALWSLNKANIKDEEYKEFYKTISNDYEEPLTWMHTKAEGTLEYTTLFYIPKKAPFDLFRVDYTPGIKLYINRVFITEDDKELMPTYLRFVKGVIDSKDLPLNVSREILQSNRILAKIKDTSVKKILNELDKMMKNDNKKYEEFYKEFGKVLKEGLYNDFTNREKILDLLILKSLKNPEAISLSKYKENIKKDQKEIYFICGEDENILRNSPILEKFKAKDLDVLILSEDIDQIVFPMVSEYKDLKFVNVNEADIKNDEKKDEGNKEEHKSLIEEFKNILKDKIKDVKVSNSLVDSPICIVTDKDDPSYAMAKMMKQMGNNSAPSIKPILEINPKHKLIQKFQESKDIVLKEDIAKLLLEQGKLYNGEKIENSVDFINSLNRIIEKSL